MHIYADPVDSKDASDPRVVRGVARREKKLREHWKDPGGNHEGLSSCLRSVFSQHHDRSLARFISSDPTARSGTIFLVRYTLIYRATRGLSYCNVTARLLYCAFPQILCSFKHG